MPTYEWIPASSGGAAAVAADRRLLLKRTYGHLLGAAMGFLIVELALYKLGWMEPLGRMLLSGRGAWALALGGFMVVGWFATRIAATSMSVPAQYGALAIYVVAQAVLFAPMLWVADTYAPGAIQSAGLITLLGFAGLTAIAFLMGEDFTFLGGLLRWGMVCALLVIVGALVFDLQLGTWFSVLMIALAGAAVLHDTSSILHHYPADRHVLAALQLFASVALMFWYVLRLILASRR